MKSILVVALAAIAIALGAFFYVKDTEYRKLHGTVTQVTLFNYAQQVDDIEAAKPVLVYFYAGDRANQKVTAEDKAVAEFAWDNAGNVHVVSVNAGQLENLPLVIAHGATRNPAYVILYKGKIFQGSIGAPATQAELERLLERATATR